MGIVVTVMNMKGGVGKSTVAMHLAARIGTAIFSQKPRRVLAIDYDPQFNLSQAFIPAPTYFALEKDRKTTLSILLDDDSKLDPFELQVSGNHTPPSIDTLVHRFNEHSKGSGGLHVVPSTLDLMYVALGQSDTKTKPMEERFAKTIDECRTKYDIIFIDCHPAGSLFTKTSLRNSDHVVIPVVSDSSYAVRGIGLMLQFISDKRIGKTGPVPHILFNKAPRTGSDPAEATIRKDGAFSKYCMVNTFKKYKIFSEPSGGRGFCWNSQKPYSTEAMTNVDQVAHELIQKIGA